MNDTAAPPAPNPRPALRWTGATGSVPLVDGGVVLGAISRSSTPGADAGSATGPEMSGTIAAG